jgi:aminocarboxymuconate-semialdehyde decarboxylase
MTPDRNRQRTIDIHTHVIPRRLAKSAERGEARHGITFGRDGNGRITASVGARTVTVAWPNPLETPAERIKAMDEMRVDVHVLSLSPLMHWYQLDASAGVRMAKEANDDLAEMVATHPDRFVGLAFLPLQDSAAAIEELERCINVHGFVGVMVGSHVDGLDWDADELFPVLAAVRDLGALVFVHPAHGRANSFLPRYHLRNLIGNPFETTIAVASLIFGGVLDRLPDLDICLAHGGGYACLGADRLDHGRQVRAEAQDTASLPSEYLRRLYYDTMVFSHRGLSNLVEVVGADRVVLGSDYPADMGEPRPVDFIESHPDLTDDQRRLILGGTMERLLTARTGARA